MQLHPAHQDRLTPRIERCRAQRTCAKLLRVVHYTQGRFWAAVLHLARAVADLAPFRRPFVIHMFATAHIRLSLDVSGPAPARRGAGRPTAQMDATSVTGERRGDAASSHASRRIRCWASQSPVTPREAADGRQERLRDDTPCHARAFAGCGASVERHLATQRDCHSHRARRRRALQMRAHSCRRSFAGR
jgi:hypothetical protein